MSSASMALCGWMFAATPHTERQVAWKVDESDALLEAELDRAESIVSDEMEEEAPQISKRAFDRASLFLRAQSRASKEKFGCFPPVPNMSPGPKGSVDLQWERPGLGMLINIPSADAMATFYGDGEESHRVKGSFDPKNANLGIVAWLNED